MHVIDERSFLNASKEGAAKILDGVPAHVRNFRSF